MAVCWLVDQLVVGWSVIISLKRGKLQFHAPIEALLPFFVEWLNHQIIVRSAVITCMNKEIELSNDG